MLLNKSIDLKFGIYTKADAFNTVENRIDFYSFINT